MRALFFPCRFAYLVSSYCIISSTPRSQQHWGREELHILSPIRLTVVPMYPRSLDRVAAAILVIIWSKQASNRPCLERSIPPRPALLTHVLKQIPLESCDKI
jgi:hypothetical protein